MNEVLVRFFRHAEAHYRKPDGTPSKEVKNLADSVRPVEQLYGHTPAREPGPPLAEGGPGGDDRRRPVRKVINSRVNRVRRVFKWPVSEEPIPAAREERYAARRAGRRTKGQPSQTCQRKPDAAKLPWSGTPSRATPLAIAAGVEKANRRWARLSTGAEFDPVHHWHPNQLQHATPPRIGIGTGWKRPRYYSATPGPT